MGIAPTGDRLTTYLQLHSIGHPPRLPIFHKKRTAQEAWDYQLIWVLAGRGLVVAEDQRHEVRRGDLICFRKGQAHEYGPYKDAPWDNLWVHFDGRLAPAFFNRIRQFGGLVVKLEPNAELREHWMELVIFRETHERRPSAVVRLNTGLYALLGFIIHRLEMQRTTSIKGGTPFDVHHLQSFIHDRLSGVITLDDLVGEARLSRAHFIRTFEKLFRVSPMQYVLQLRVERASSLLIKTNLPVKQISQAVGCEDTHYFSRLFRKMTGQSPSEYREPKHPRLAKP